jgi:hydrogenase maturation protein HypF
LLWVDGASLARLGHLRPLPLPGGDRAAREPWRMAAAVLNELGRGGEIAGRFPAQAGAAQMAAVLRRGFNCPRTTSMGRWFDAAAGLLNLCAVMQHEAQAAHALEQAAAEHAAHAGWPAPLPGGWRIGGDGVLDLLPLLESLCSIRDAGYGAALFHATLVAALSEWTLRAAAAGDIGTVALGGGCFFNRLLSGRLRESLASRGMTVLEARQQLPGDTAIALGQAWVARRRLAA